MVSCSNDDGNDNECQAIRNKYNEAIEKAWDDIEQKNSLIQSKDQALRESGCL